MARPQNLTPTTPMVRAGHCGDVMDSTILPFLLGCDGRHIAVQEIALVRFETQKR